MKMRWKLVIKTVLENNVSGNFMLFSTKTRMIFSFVHHRLNLTDIYKQIVNPVSNTFSE